VSARPDDSPQIIPYLYYEDATAALDFLVNAFGFEVKSAFRDDNGDVLTAQLRTGDGVVMIGPGMDGFGTRGVQDPEWATTRMFVYVDDVDDHFERARGLRNDRQRASRAFQRQQDLCGLRLRWATVDLRRAH
jgi:hypothetical protein